MIATPLGFPVDNDSEVMTRGLTGRVLAAQDGFGPRRGPASSSRGVLPGHHLAEDRVAVTELAIGRPGVVMKNCLSFGVDALGGSGRFVLTPALAIAS